MLLKMGSHADRSYVSNWDSSLAPFILTSSQCPSTLLNLEFNSEAEMFQQEAIQFILLVILGAALPACGQDQSEIAHIQVNPTSSTRRSRDSGSIPC
jgi:hypothetical protein